MSFSMSAVGPELASGTNPGMAAFGKYSRPMTEQSAISHPLACNCPAPDRAKLNLLFGT
jgi:hypothetical protein